MHNIEIDFEVFKALTNLRDTEKTTYNDVVRRLLNLNDVKVSRVESVTKSDTQLSAWVTKGVTFPEGTEFRASYKGSTVYASVRNSALVVNGEKASSPSDAARIVTGNSVNGWTFWQCRLPGESRWRGLQGMRNS
jgi:predicted CopG family antitoxin